MNMILGQKDTCYSILAPQHPLFFPATYFKAKSMKILIHSVLKEAHVNVVFLQMTQILAFLLKV